MTAGAGRAPDVWDRDHRILTIGLVLTVSMAAFEALAVATVLPATVGDIGGLPLYGWTFSGFMLAEIVGIGVAGRSGDRHGPAAPFALGGILFCAGLVGAGIAEAMPVLIGCRVLQGLGAGAISTLSYAAVARGYPDAARPHMLALLSTAWVVPGLIGPAIAAAVEAWAGWRWIFLGLAPVSALAIALAVPGLRRLGSPHDARPGASRTAASLVLALAGATFLFGLGATGIPMQALAALAFGVGVLAFRQLVPVGTLRARPGLPAAIAVMGVLSTSFFGAEVLVPLSLTEVRSRSVAFAGVTLTGATVAWTIGAWVQARLAAGGGRRALVASGLVLLAAGIAAVATVAHPAVPVEIAPVAWALAGLGMGMAYSTTALAVLESAPAGDEGRASAAMQLANVLGTALGSGAGGAALAQLGDAAGIAVAVVATDAVTVVLALGGAVLARRLTEPATGAPR